jgi:hypothetical protein
MVKEVNILYAGSGKSGKNDWSADLVVAKTSKCSSYKFQHICH